MTHSITPAIVVTNNSTAIVVSYAPTVTQSRTPEVSHAKANTNVTLEYRP